MIQSILFSFALFLAQWTVTTRSAAVDVHVRQYPHGNGSPIVSNPSQAEHTNSTNNAGSFPHGIGNPSKAATPAHSNFQGLTSEPGPFSHGLGTARANKPFARTTTTLLTKNLTGTNHDAVICHIANTRTSLYIQLYDDISAAAMTKTISSATSYVEMIIRSSGDGWLPTDPFVFEDKHGLRFMVESAKKQHLTWGILGSTVKGLQDCVIHNGWYQEVRMQIFDAPWGHVGDGSLLRT